MGAWLRRQLSALGGSRPLFDLPELIEKPDGTRVMVIAPHADDEALGCGGTLYKHHLAGDSVTAVFMTDGSQGDAMSGGITGQALIDLREREAREAAAILGIRECVFLRNPDTSLQCSPQTIAQLSGLLESTRPDVVYVPSPLDTHRDHRQACLIAAKAFANCPWPIEVYLYEVWAPLQASCAVTIDIDRKTQAVRVYRSQMDERELYVTGMTCLARYRGMTCVPGRDVPVECFMRMDRAAFVKFATSTN